MSYFGEPTARIAAMKETLLNITPQVCVERAVYTTQAYKEHRDKPSILKRAYAIRNTLENMTIFLEDGTLLAGNQASTNRAAPIFPEYAIGWVIDELDMWEKRNGDRFTITEENKQILRDMAPFWQGITLQDKALALMPPAERQCYEMCIRDSPWVPLGSCIWHNSRAAPMSTLYPFSLTTFQMFRCLVFCTAFSLSLIHI